MTDYARPHADGGITVTTLPPVSYDELLDALIDWRLATTALDEHRLSPEPLREIAADKAAKAEDDVRELLTAALSREQARVLSNQLRCLLNAGDLHPSGDRADFPTATRKAWITNAAKASQS
ncbi:hypothetical protein [Segeticoccus rhizosphaerae]|uniref:hypothetical protein n=1 Tax=Segeticoccus rhizosphaerae TaxID=1104777 RepID=UPI0012648981|nr:hypothetical protein [Segeticoccus rhizosphaerae]